MMPGGGVVTKPYRRKNSDPPTVPCCACSGRFGFRIVDDRPIAYHSTPFCPAFIAIESTMDALRHAERCDMAIKPS